MKRLMQLTGLAAALWAGATLSACSHTPAETSVGAGSPSVPAGPSMEAKQIANAEQAPFVTEIGFRKGKRELSATSQSQLNRVISEARAHGQIDEVRVITWSDEEYPSVHTGKLSSAQRKLADQRNTQIKDYIKHIDSGTDVDTYNMAERPSSISEMFGTSNARVKKALEVAGIPNTDSGVKMPAKASKSIVLVILKE